MNWEQIQGKWSQAKGSIRQQWGKLTDDDLEVIAGSKDKLVGRLQERYGLAKEDAMKQIDTWVTTVSSSNNETKAEHARETQEAARSHRKNA